MFSKILLAVFVLHRVKLISTQNCTIAPVCPNTIIWTQDSGCKDGYFPLIETSLINGQSVKTVCCSEALTCSTDSVCGSQLLNLLAVNGQNLNNSVCTKCVTSWVKFNFDLAPLRNGILIGSGSGPLFVGRVLTANGYLPGFFDMSKGLQVLYGGSLLTVTNSIEYLTLNNNFTYSWKPSSNGVYEPYAVTVDGTNTAYIAKVASGGIVFISELPRTSGGVFYYDGTGNLKFTTNYELLVAYRKPPTTPLPLPTCPIEWRSTSGISNNIPSFYSQSVIVAQNGIIVGDPNRSYNWIKLGDIQRFTPATLSIPGTSIINVGRIIVNGSSIVGRVDLTTGIMQNIDDFGNVNNVICFEVLACADKPTQPGMCQKPNEFYSECGSPCANEVTCNNPTGANLICPDICIVGCFCRPGFVRDSNGNCILPSQCNNPLPTNPTTTICSRPNEIYAECGSPCVGTCNNLGAAFMCTPDCTPRCYCQIGYVRDNYGNCILPTQCSNPSPFPFTIPSIPTVFPTLPTTSPNSPQTTSTPYNGPPTPPYPSTTVPYITSTFPSNSQNTLPPTACIIIWKFYGGTDNLQTSAVALSSSNTNFVGQAFDGALGKISFISSNQPCFNANCSNALFQYIQKSASNSYSWVATQTGMPVQNAVEIEPGKQIGQATVNGQVVVGIVTTYGLFYKLDSGSYASASNYQILTCTTSPLTTITPNPASTTTAPGMTTSTSPSPTSCSLNPIPPVKTNCVPAWKTYTGSPLINVAVSADGSQNIFVGVLNGIIGRIRYNTATSTYCFAFDFNNCSSSFVYLEKTPSYTFEWKPSYSGSTVSNALNYGPATIARVADSQSIFVGSVINGVADMVYQDDTTNTWKGALTYDVLTCLAPAVNSPPYNWITYPGSGPLPSTAVSAGPGVYIGMSGDTIGIIQPIPGTNNYCLLSLTSSQCSSTFNYLSAGPPSSWVPSQNGATVPDAVNNAGGYVGRVTVNGVPYYGTVMPGVGLVYFDKNNNPQIATNYEVLTVLGASGSISPDVLNTLQWVPYVPPADISTLGVAIDPTANTVSYVGLIGTNLGLIQKRQGSYLYCLQLNSFGCIDRFQYLNGSNRTLTWTPSMKGFPVTNAVLFSNNFIGRAQKNGVLYVGTVTVGVGMVYYDEFNVLQTSATYDVLTSVPGFGARGLLNIFQEVSEVTLESNFLKFE